MADLSEVEKILGYTFNNKSLLRTALTHSSYAKEKSTEDYERLEFLGDSFLDYIIALLLFEHFPEKKEGEMTKMRSALVKEDTLSQLNDSLHLNNYLLIVEGKQSHPVSESKAVKCDVFESVIGAILLDSQFDIPFLKKYLEDLFRPFLYVDNTDYKSLILESLSKKGSKHAFSFIGEININDPFYHVQLYVDDKLVSEGEGRTKKKAEQDACHNFYKLVFHQ